MTEASWARKNFSGGIEIYQEKVYRVSHQVESVLHLSQTLEKLLKIPQKSMETCNF